MQTAGSVEQTCDHLLVLLRTLAGLVDATTVAEVMAVAARECEQTFGAAGLTFEQIAADRRFGDRERALAADLAQHTAKALERARARDELERTCRAREQLFARLGHELRNPLAPILTALQLMRLRGDAQNERERGVIERQAQNLVRVVDDLLDAARIERAAHPPERRETELGALVSAAVDQTNALLEGKAHRVRVSVPARLSVCVDAERVVQMLADMLDHAAKYAPRGGVIEVGASEGAEQVTVSVRDTGGDITLSMGLPRAAVKREDAAARRNARRLLLVDDNEDAATLLAMSLEELGHEVHVAYDPNAALALARDLVPEIAILDIGLPGMDGYELAAALRAQQPDRPPRVVALSGYGGADDHTRSQAAGFAAHLVKPVDLGTLQSALADT